MMPSGKPIDRKMIDRNSQSKLKKPNINEINSENTVKPSQIPPLTPPSPEPQSEERVLIPTVVYRPSDDKIVKKPFRDRSQTI